jgi:hypothetical protein
MTGTDYSISLWFWSGTAKGILEGTEWLVSRGNAFGSPGQNDQIGIREDEAGNRKIIYQGPGVSAEMGTDKLVERWKWHHLVFVRSGEKVRVLLDGASMEASLGTVPGGSAPDTFFFGGSCTGEGNFEGRLDEIAVFDRVLSEDQILNLYRTGSGAP